MKEKIDLFVRLYCEQYECDSSTLRVHGYCPSVSEDDLFDYELFCTILFSTVNDKGVSIYNVCNVENDVIKLEPSVFGHTFIGCLDLFISLIKYYSDSPEDCLIYGSSSYTYAIDENGKPYSGMNE